MDRLVFKHIDFDLAERIIASGPIKRTKAPKKHREPRAACTYRQNGPTGAPDRWRAKAYDFRDRSPSARSCSTVHGIGSPRKPIRARAIVRRRRSRCDDRRRHHRRPRLSRNRRDLVGVGAASGQARDIPLSILIWPRQVARFIASGVRDLRDIETARRHCR